MNDIVRPMWDHNVVITGVQKGSTIELKDINQLDSD